MKYKLSVNTLFALFCSLNNFFSWGFVCLFRFIIMFDRVINSAAETSKKIPPPPKKKINITLLFFLTFLKWFSLLSENFLPENKLCGWLFTDLHNTYVFSWPLANFSDFLLAKKNHISFIIIYITIYMIDFPWLCLSMITLSLTHFGCAVIVPDASNNVQTIRTIIWKRYPDDRKWPGWLIWPLSIACIELSSMRAIGRIV